MAKVDIAGLLTGLGQAPIDPMLSMDARQRSLARVQELGGQLRRGVGALTGVETRTTQEMAQQALAQFDIRKKEDRPKILEVVRRLSPERVPALQMAFRELEKSDMLEGQEAGIGQINPQFYTAESIQQYARNFRETGIKDYSLLKEVDKVAEAYKVGEMGDIRTAMAERSKAFQSSAGLKTKLTTMEEILDTGLQTGALAGLSKSAKSLVQSLFPDTEIEGLAEAEVFEALSNQLALLIRNPDSGMGLPGATSNRDLQFLIDSVPNLQKSPEGNKTLIKVYRKAFKLQDDVIREQNRLIRGNNGVPPLDLQRRLEEFVLNYDVLGDELRQEVQTQAESGDDYEQDELDRLLAIEEERRKESAEEVKAQQSVNPRLGR
jgi:hypothetical protein